MLLAPVRWPDGRRVSLLDDRLSGVLFGLAAAAAAAGCWLAGRMDLLGWPNLVPYRWQIVAVLTTAGVSCGLWARWRLTARGSGAAPSRLWAPARWPDGRRVSPSEDRIASAAAAAATALALVLCWASGRAGMPTQAGSAISGALLRGLLTASAVACLVAVVRIRAVAAGRA